jgi:hypothetical protein
MTNNNTQNVLVPGQMEIDPVTGKIVGFRVAAPDDFALPHGVLLEAEENRDFYHQPTVEELVREQNYVPMTISEIFESASELFESEEDRQNFCRAVEEAKK